jgi:hypothetical protein
MVGPPLNIKIEYSMAKSKRYTTIFQFKITKTADGRKVWVQQGDGITLEQLRDEINHEPENRTTPFDVAPFLDVRVNSVENNSNSDTNHPLKISYSWQNRGHVPATGVYIEWGVMRLRDSVKFV